MKKLLFRMLLVVLAILLLSNGCKGQETKILFLGNSLIYTNELPRVFDSIATDMQAKVSIDEITYANFKILTHMEYEDTIEAIMEGDWNHVICNEHNYLLLDPTLHSTELHPAWKKLQELFKSKSTEVHMFINWGFTLGMRGKENLDSYDSMQSKLIEVTEQLTHQYDFTAIPIGQAWRVVISQYPDLELRRFDKIHPTPAGTYLTACVIYSHLFNEEVVNVTIPEGIEPDIALAIQQIAWETVSSYSVK